MAKLYAEVTSDKGGRKVSKTGDELLCISLSRGNYYLGKLKVISRPNSYDIFFNGLHIQGGDDFDGNIPTKTA